MKLTFERIIIGLIVIVAFLTAFWSYSHLPALVVTHWNEAGVPNGYMSRFWGAYMVPLILLGLALLFELIPFIDPRRQNIKKFRPTYDRFVITLLAFLYYIYLLTLRWNISGPFDLWQWMIPAFGFLMIGVGMLLSRAEPNWFIGIRTPWTLSNDEVWYATHRLGSKFFIAAGIVSFLGIFSPTLAVWFLIVPISIAGLGSVVYSYVKYRQLEG